MATICIIDDEPDVLSSLAAFFERTGHRVVTAECGSDGLRAVARSTPDLVLLDMELPDMPGLDVLGALRASESMVIVITGHGDVPRAVEAMRRGAENFLIKPVDQALLAMAAERAMEKARLRRMSRAISDRRGASGHGALLGTSAEMRELGRQIELLARSDRTPVLLMGERGTGKGRVAAAIHALSPRTQAPFLQANCAGLSAAFLDSELFGHERGAFLGAGERKPGLFEAARGGSILLNEMGELAAELQPKVLKALETMTFRRVGGTDEIDADVRLIAATDRDLVAEIREGRFREDLYYRISTMPVHLPPLRARAREDVLEIIARLLDELLVQLPGSPAALSEEALDHLLRYSWPGNVRELRNVLERGMILAREMGCIDAEHLPHEVRRAPTEAGIARHTPRSLAEVERLHIERTLRVHRQNRTRAARELGISRATLINKIKSYGLERNEGAEAGGRRAAGENADQTRGKRNGSAEREEA